MRISPPLSDLLSLLFVAVGNDIDDTVFHVAKRLSVVIYWLCHFSSAISLGAYCHEALALPRSFDYAMSQVPSTSPPSSNFESVFSAAFKAYKKQTKKDIASHPLATQLRSCDSSSAILDILRTQVQTFDETQSADERWTKWLDPTVNVLFKFSVTLGNGVGVVNSATLCSSRSTL